MNINPNFNINKKVVSVSIVSRDGKDFQQTTYDDGSLVQQLVNKAFYQPTIDNLNAQLAQVTALQNACQS